VKFAAKIASDVCKPDGIREVRAEALLAFLAPLPIERLFGVGPKTAARLRGLGITTLAEVARYPTDALLAKLGEEGLAYQALARGEDPRRVEPDRAAKSVSAEDTFERDLDYGPELRRAVMAQAERVAERLRAHGLVAEVVVLKLKDKAFQTRTRRHTLAAASSDGRVFVDTALELLAAACVRAPPVRLSGIGAQGLQLSSAPRQLALAANEGRGDRLMASLDAIRGRFGRAAIARAELLDTEEREQRRAERRGNSLDLLDGDASDED
jgi:DNA polymerase-4